MLVPLSVKYNYETFHAAAAFTPSGAEIRHLRSRQLDEYITASL
jgi:hypothetical protein